MRDWAPGTRLSGVGVQRLEFTGFVSREDFEQFVEEVMQRLALTSSSAEVRPERPTAIRFGAVGLRGETHKEEDEPLRLAGINYTMGEEVSAIKWIHQEVASRGSLHLLEAEATVRSLSVAMHGESRIVIPLLELKEFDQYTTTHSMNVAVLAMALAEYLGLDARDVRTFGVAGLLHDLGKVRIPKDILNKPGALTFWLQPPTGCICVAPQSSGHAESRKPGGRRLPPLCAPQASHSEWPPRSPEPSPRKLG